MKKDEVQVGATYAVKVSGSVVPVKITQEKWTSDKHTGWIGLNVKTKRPVRIKSAAKLRNLLEDKHGAKPSDAKSHSEQSDPPAKPETPEAPTTTKPKGGKAKKEPTAPNPKKVSGLDAAAIVLKDAATPMSCKEIVEKAASTGLWTSPGGKTPEATLYAAIIREIAAKGRDARFRKTERGRFAHSGVEAA